MFRGSIFRSCLPSRTKIYMLGNIDLANTFPPLPTWFKTTTLILTLCIPCPDNACPIHEMKLLCLQQELTVR